MLCLGCLAGWWLGGGRVGRFGMDCTGEGDEGSRTGRPKTFLEAMGIEPATHGVKSRLTTNSTVLTVMTWRVVFDLTGEYGRIWKNRS